MKLSVTFPFIDTFDDYHEIYFMENTLSDIFGKKIKGIEIGLYRRRYVGFFYTGKKPNKKEIVKILASYMLLTKTEAAVFLKEGNWPIVDEEDDDNDSLCRHGNMVCIECKKDFE